MTELSLVPEIAKYKGISFYNLIKWIIYDSSINRQRQNISIFSGDDKTSMNDMILGFKGNISVTANIAPLQMHEMCMLATRGEKEKAAIINKNLDILHDNLFIESNPIPVKWALNRMNLIKKGIRLPLTWLDEKYEKTLEDSLIKANIISKKQR